MSQTIQLAAQVTGAIRRETLEGREHVVIPATLVRSQVLRNNLGRTYLPAEEITDTWAEMANGMPVILDHPTNRGQPVSARDPQVLNRQGIGRLFNVRAEDGALKGDVFIDPARSDDVKPLSAVLEKVERGQPAELSTAFPLREIENESGDFEGEPFDKVIRPGGFDHLAVFAEKTGACSVRDGCGLGVNCDCGDQVDNDNAEQVAESVFEKLWNKITNQESAMEREDVYAALEEAGCPLGEERLAELEDEELTALAESYASEASAENEDEEPDPAENATDPAVVEKLAALEAQVADLAADRKAEKEDLVTRLAENERCPFEEAELSGFDLDRLEKLAQMAKVRNYAGRGGPKATENAEPAFAEPVPYYAENEKES